MASSMSFFDTTPLGRIINRFSKDVDVIDTVIARNFGSLLQCFLQVITVPIVIGYSTPWFLVLMLPITLIYTLVQVRIINTLF